MVLVDVNILIYAHREDAADHPRFREWLANTLAGGEPYGVSELVLSGFIRCSKARARGNLVQDAYLAALAIESNCEWITLDRDFGRFPGLQWRRPF